MDTTDKTVSNLPPSTIRRYSSGYGTLSMSQSFDESSTLEGIF